MPHFLHFISADAVHVLWCPGRAAGLPGLLPRPRAQRPSRLFLQHQQLQQERRHVVPDGRRPQRHVRPRARTTGHAAQVQSDLAMSGWCEFLVWQQWTLHRDNVM